MATTITASFASATPPSLASSIQGFIVASPSACIHQKTSIQHVGGWLAQNLCAQEHG